ncbi:hypothetical protein RI138_02175 [Streptomyces sp. C11-1]|uniref:CsbD family protein n=1 Tax=Streptomyces durocortorensis TaxID=2811104 RepID=A0ABY9VP49_9ACTN|nr:hypothetical protein [Streptomyces durocortorensis]WNF25707.1 hypothetical protein RI138_02175 [Streptomyces durocortorensis]
MTAQEDTMRDVGRLLRAKVLKVRGLVKESDGKALDDPARKDDGRRQQAEARRQEQEDRNEQQDRQEQQHGRPDASSGR